MIFFLFAYTILRSILNQLGRVIALLLFILILLIIPFCSFNSFNSLRFSPIKKIIFFIFSIIIILLTWLGSQAVKYPIIYIRKVITILYFSFFLLILL